MNISFLQLKIKTIFFLVCKAKLLLVEKKLTMKQPWCRQVNLLRVWHAKQTLNPSRKIITILGDGGGGVGGGGD